MIALEQIKKNVTQDINEHVTYLYDYFLHSDNSNKEQIVGLFNKQPKIIENLVGDLAILYYSVAFSYDSTLYSNIKSDILNIIKEEPTLNNIVKIYSELIEIKDINKNLTKLATLEKQEELNDFYRFINDSIC